MIHRTWKQLTAWLAAQELEIILHPSRRRLQWLGVFTIFGHLVFWWLWSSVFPQTYEDWQVRLFMAATGIGLIMQPAGNQCHAPSMRLYFSLVCWLQLPFFFIWMYWMNAGSAMWLATVATMVVVYYHLTDWRIATLGLLTGGFLGGLAAQEMLGELHHLPVEHLIVLCFSWISALLLALSSANLRRERLQHSLNVIGIMAHELRTPLATMALIAQAIRMESNSKDERHEERLKELATRTEALTRAINHHIDLQMTNARYTHQPQAKQILSAQQLVQKVIQDYPFGSKRERQCAQVILHSDFWFFGSEQQFTQVLNNLLKNAMHSLKTAQSRYDRGDLRIEIGARYGVGRIQIKDRGVGIKPNQLNLIFEPFFSTANETGHGLGLAFCKQVIEGSQGTIMVQSSPAMGATFTLQLPCQPTPLKEMLINHEISPLSSA